MRRPQPFRGPSETGARGRAPLFHPQILRGNHILYVNTTLVATKDNGGQYDYAVFRASGSEAQEVAR